LSRSLNENAPFASVVAVAVPGVAVTSTPERGVIALVVTVPETSFVSGGTTPTSPGGPASPAGPSGPCGPSDPCGPADPLQPSTTTVAASTAAQLHRIKLMTSPSARRQRG